MRNERDLNEELEECKIGQGAFDKWREYKRVKGEIRVERNDRLENGYDFNHIASELGLIK